MSPSEHRIVHIGNYLNPGCDGVAAAIRGQCDALKALGTDVEVWQFEPGLTDIRSNTSESGVRVHRLPRFRNPIFSAIWAPRISQEWINRHLPTVSLFHLHSVFSPRNNFVAKLGVPYAIAPQGGWTKKVLHGRRATAKSVWITFFEKKLWSNASFVQAVSATELNDLRNLPDVNRLALVPNGVEIPSISIEKTLPKVHFLFLGRLAVDQKGLDLLVHAYAAALRRCGSMPDLLIAGPDFRGGRDFLQGLIASLQLGAKVHLVGPVFGEEKSKLMSEARVFVHPSRWEGMPLSILEALAHGTPCIVSKATGLAEWMVQRNCGWITESNADALSDLLARIASSTEEIHEKTVNTQPSVLADYSWPSIAIQLRDLYLQVIGETQ